MVAVSTPALDAWRVEVGALTSPPRCEHVGTCAGCALADPDAVPPVAAEAAAFFAAQGVTPLEVRLGAPTGWRRRAKLAVRADPGTGLLTLGLFMRDSHTIVPIVPACLMHHPAINEAAARVQDEARALGVAAYEEGGAGAPWSLRYVQLTVDEASSTVQVGLVVHARRMASPATGTDPGGSVEERGGGGRAAALALGERLDSAGHDVWFNFNDKDTNTIFGPRWEPLGSGGIPAVSAPRVWDALGNGVTVPLAPGAFAQANGEMVRELVETMADEVGKLEGVTGKVLELYAGSGGLGLSLASRLGLRCRCIELNAESHDAFGLARSTLLTSPAFNAARNPAGASAVAQSGHVVADAGDPQVLREELWGGTAEGDVVLVDPPRKGLHPATLDALCRVAGHKPAGGAGGRGDGASPAKARGPSALVYVSCGYDAFKRDLAALRAARWRIQHVSAYRFFPGANHLELLAVLSRPGRPPATPAVTRGPKADYDGLD